MTGVLGWAAPTDLHDIALRETTYTLTYDVIFNVGTERVDTGSSLVFSILGPEQ